MNDDTIENIRKANEAKAEAQKRDQVEAQQMQQSASLERTIFNSFQSLVDVLQHTSTKAEALALVVDALEKLDKQGEDHEAELALIKSGLNTLEKELKAIPSDSLKQLPKFLEQREVIKVSNLDEMNAGFDKIEKAVKAMKLDVAAPKVHVEAPNVNVPAPIVNVPKLDWKPFQTAVLNLLDVLKEANARFNFEGESLKTHQTNLLISETFDEWKAVYDSFDDEDPEPSIVAINYYFKGKKVATLKYSYDTKGNLSGVKKV